MRKFISTILFIFITFNSFSSRLDSLENALSNANHDTTKISLYHLISWDIRSSDPDKALDYALKGFNIAKKFGDKRGMESCVNNIGVIKAMQGEYDESLKNFKKNLSLNKELKNREGEATANNNLGLVYYYKGDFSKAVEHYVASLNIYDEIDDENGKASAYNNLGLIYENKTDYDKSLYYQKKALRLRLKQNDIQTLAYSYGNIGNIYYLKENSDTALIYFLKAEKLFEEVNDIHSIGQLVGNIGKIYEDRKEFNLALQYYKRGMEIQTEYGDSYGMAINFLNISEVNLKINNWVESIIFAEKGVKLSKEIGAKDITKQGYTALKHALYQSGRYKEAYDYSELLMEIKDSIFSEENQEKIAELETKYGAEQKEKENELLRKNGALKDLKLERSMIINYGVSGALITFTILGLFIFRGYSQKKKALILLEEKNQQVVKQKDVIEKKNTDILDSLNYAKRIQYAILPPKSYVDDVLPNSFIFYRPKDIVSGDFYWVDSVSSEIKSRTNKKVLFASVDCTGHGVPGAFMSIVGYNGLNQAVLQETDNPAKILDNLNEIVSNTLHQTQNTQIKEGMDIALCSIDINNLKLEFAGAYNSVFILRGDEIIEKKGDRFAIGSKHYRDELGYTNHKVDLHKGDMIYITTDGYVDQFGGPKDKKFKISNFKKMLLKIANKPIVEQKEIVESTIDEWKGAQDQVDDICVIGVRI